MWNCEWKLVYFEVIDYLMTDLIDLLCVGRINVIQLANCRIHQQSKSTATLLAYIEEIENWHIKKRSEKKWEKHNQTKIEFHYECWIDWVDEFWHALVFQSWWYFWEYFQKFRKKTVHLRIVPPTQQISIWIRHFQGHVEVPKELVMNSQDNIMYKKLIGCIEW